MARIPDGELERVKREVSLVRLIEGQGIALISQGKDLACRCPWHEGDDTPSCVVTPSTNLWHCFGCNAGGTVIDWVMRSQRVSFRHACELLLKEHPALAAGPAAALPKLSPGKLRSAQSFSLPEGDADADAALLNQVIDFYHETLKGSPEALAYLEKRGLGSMELIERFRLGYANRTLAYRLAPKQYKAGAVLRTALQRIGILRESGHEHLNGSIVVPLFNADTATDGTPRHVVGAYGRKLLDNLRPGTPKHLYLPGPHRGVLNGDGLAGQAEVIVCEALIDALTFWNAGYRNVTSCYGINGLTEELLAALKGSGAQRVLIAFDRDEAGDRGAEAMAERLMPEGLECFRLLFPKGMDANAYACAVKPADKSLGVVIRAAQWLGRGVKPVLTTRCVVSVAAESLLAASTPVTSESDLPPLATVPVEIAPAPLAAEGNAAKEEILPQPEAAAMPPLPPPEPQAQADEQQLLITYGERCYRVRGWPKQLTEALKVNVLVRRGDDAADAGAGLHVDTLDLYQAKARAAFARCAASELRVDEVVIQHDLGRLLLKLEQLIEERAKAAETPQVTAPAKMSPEDTAAALAFLRDPQLLTRIVADIERVGLVGEPSNALVAYLACISRKLSNPLAVLIQSTSAAGKSTLMDTILSLIPEEDRVRRDHAKYLTLIDVIALLRQHQREIKTLKRGEQVIEYIEVNPADIALANELAHEVLGRSLDELPPQTRRVLGMIEDWVQGQVQQRSLSRSDVRLTRRQLRAVCGMSDAAIRVHLERLITMEYVRAAAGRNGQRYEYELLFDGDLERSAPQMIGLIDAAALRTTSVDTAGTLQGKTLDLAPTSQAACTDPAPTLQGVDPAENGSAASTLPAAGAEVSADERLGNAAPSGRNPSRTRRAGAPSSLPLAASYAAAGR
jgi:DNA primase